MLAKKNRLSGKENFLKIKSQGVLYQSDHFGLSVYRKNNQEPTRVGFIVSTKVSKRSTDRNQVRRSLSDGTRIFFDQIKTGLDIIFLAKPKIIGLTRVEIIEEVKKALTKIK